MQVEKYLFKNNYMMSCASGEGISFVLACAGRGKEK